MNCGILFVMRRSLPSMTWLLWVVALAFLAVRMTEIHWHLCFDGHEPRTSLHVGDDVLEHHGPQQGPVQHQDREVSLTGQMLAKFTKVDFDLPLALLGAGLLWLLFDPWSKFFP